MRPLRRATCCSTRRRSGTPSPYQSRSASLLPQAILVSPCLLLTYTLHQRKHSERSPGLLQAHFIDTAIQHPDVFDPSFPLCGLELRDQVTQHGFSPLSIDCLEATLDMGASVVKMRSEERR